MVAACSTGSNHPVAVGSSPSVSVPAPIPSSTPSPSPTVTPVPAAAARVSPTLLFAAFEWNRNVAGSATLAILDLTGREVARTSFAPPSTPSIGCLGTPPPTAAYVAAGKAFYADAGGVIRSLSPTGQVATVTSFSTTSQQMLSFSVNPDGNRFLGTVLTAPAVVSKDALCSRSPGSGYSGDFTLSAYSAQEGASPRLLYTETVPLEQGEPFPCILKLAGWDSGGPLGIYPACLAPGGGPGRYFGGPPVRVDATTGRVSGPIADPTVCQVRDVASSGDFVCNPVPAGAACCWSGDLSVRRPDGSEIWSLKAPPGVNYDYDFLAPDEQHVLSEGSGGVVLGRDGSMLPLANVSYVAGWFDDSTVAAYDGSGDLGYIALGASQSFVSLRPLGWQFVATVRA